MSYVSDHSGHFDSFDDESGDGSLNLLWVATFVAFCGIGYAIVKDAFQRPTVQVFYDPPPGSYPQFGYAPSYPSGGFPPRYGPANYNGEDYY